MTGYLLRLWHVTCEVVSCYLLRLCHVPCEVNCDMFPVMLCHVTCLGSFLSPVRLCHVTCEVWLCSLLGFVLLYNVLLPIGSVIVPV